MNLNQVINMVVRMVMRRGINAGINGAMGMASKRSEAKQAQKGTDTPDADSDPRG
ncbi:MAG: hypothetical protein AAF801_10005 [Pseudomonadota bacterium]